MIYLPSTVPSFYRRETSGSVEAILQSHGFVGLHIYVVALDSTIFGADQPHQTLACGCKSLPSPQRRSNRLSVNSICENARQASFSTKHRRTRNTTTTATTVLVGVCRDAQFPSSLDSITEQPFEQTPSTANLQQTLKLRMVPCQIAAPTTYVRDEKVFFRRVSLSRVDLIQRPRTGHQLCWPIFIPFETSRNIAVLVEWKLGIAVAGIVEEDDVVVAACC